MQQEIFRELRNSLAKLYGDVASTRRVIADAGIDAARIDFGSGALNIWHAVLTEAENTAKVEKLLTAVAYEYGENEAFRKARERYVQGNKPLSEPPPSVSPTSSSTQREAWQRQLVSYRQNLALIEERMSEYIAATDIPLQLIKDKQQTAARIAELESKLGIQST